VLVSTFVQHLKRIKMQTILQHPVSATYTRTQNKTSVFRRFFSWCQAEEKNRFGWLALILAVHGCALTPLTIFAIVMSGNNIFLWVTAIAAMGLSLVTNLSAMPTRITIPAFFISVLIDAAVLSVCLSAGLNFSGVIG
jgi:hypothetical protein